MAIPKYDELTWPVLDLLKDGAGKSTRQLAAAVAQQFNLSEEEQNAKLPSGSQTYLLNRIGWAGFYLLKADLVTRPKRSHWQITNAGLKALSKGRRKLDRAALMEFPVFREYFKRFTEGRGRVAESAEIREEPADATPEEIIADAYKAIQSALKEDLLVVLRRMNAKRFEELVLDLLVAMGYGGSREEAHMTKASHDEGIDGVINEDRLGLDVIYVQAKRWQDSNSVGRKEVQSFVGALAGKQAHKGVFITTSAFTDTAVSYVSALQQKVILIDGDRLAGLLIEHNIGVSKSHTFELKRVDSDYFADE
ncbi:MAG TPA: restriction endonuclease [Verrucomicrobiae bacterium]|nr:restriction endonuclease [Verrucomicrobiae bacterium]